jgi:hypothetical protein
MKALLVRAGIDSRIGVQSPVWGDLSYRYIPDHFKDNKIHKEKRTLKHLDLAEYVSKDIVSKKINLNPEFETFSYILQDSEKNSELMSLQKNDLLVFCFDGFMRSYPEESGCFIFGYFEVKKMYNWRNLTSGEQKTLRAKLKKNSLLQDAGKDERIIVVKGKWTSKQLKSCILISETINSKSTGNYEASKTMKEFIGIDKLKNSALQAIIKEEVHLNNLKMLLGIEKPDISGIEGKIPVSLFARIVRSEKNLAGKEKEFIIGFLISKSGNYLTDAENFGTDVYMGRYKNADLLEEYFIDYYYKI